MRVYATPRLGLLADEFHRMFLDIRNEFWDDEVETVDDNTIAIVAGLLVLADSILEAS